MRTFSTPMMQQYAQIRKQYADCLLFFRLGDFYELFLDDALLGAKLLGITLTKRPRGKDGDIPMAGVPYHAASTYINKLIAAGHKVAICEQVSLPNSKGIVERAVIRIITPGTVMDDQSLLTPDHNFIMAVTFEKEMIGIALADISTGSLKVTAFKNDKNLAQIIEQELQRHSPSECIISSDAYNDPAKLGLVSQSSVAVYPFAEWKKASQAERLLRQRFSKAALSEIFSTNQTAAICVTASLLAYIEHTQQQEVTHFSAPEWYSAHDSLLLDSSTIRNLELFQTIRTADKKGSLLGLLDVTSSAAGSRLLRDWLSQPLLEKKLIVARHQAVAELLAAQSRRNKIREALSQIYDIERQMAKLSLRLATPAAIINVAQSLEAFLKIHALVTKLESKYWHNLKSIKPTAVKKLLRYIFDHLHVDTEDALSISGAIKSGVNVELDELRDRLKVGEQWLENFEKNERARTGIGSLKCKYNSVFGYYIEVSNSNLDAVPKEYVRKQTLVNAERFITPELKKQEEFMLAAQEKIDVLELRLFQEVVEYVVEHTELTTRIAHDLAELDVIAAFAELAYVRNYVCPKITVDGRLEIIEGRHPVVESLVAEEFVPNNVYLDKKSQLMMIITGPNMAGKSVYMRQVALIVLMAHIGSFVPATAADISLTDRIFVRSGASDSISDGLSTFMVEMVETASILNHVTEKSLVVMDEIGRGTSTYDGISIASAIAEYMVEHPAQPKVLFATHYHELQMLAEVFPSKVKNYQVAVERHKGKPLFLYTVVEGKSSHSFGVAVADLAGVPKSVITRAEEILAELETKAAHAPKKKINKKAGTEKSVVESLKQLDIAQTKPIEALNLLAQLQAKVSNGQS